MNRILKKSPVGNDIATNKADLGDELVKIQLYYESLCPGSRLFITTDFVTVIVEMNLDVHMNPYGNAKTIDTGNNTYTFQCQHGPAECYGNLLHACAIDIIQKPLLYVIFNSCMMNTSLPYGSDDATADKCGKTMGIDSEAIKACAKSAKGWALLKDYGDESKKVGFKYVPYVLINGVVGSVEHFKEDICKAFKNPPPACNM